MVIGHINQEVNTFNSKLIRLGAEFCYSCALGTPVRNTDNSGSRITDPSKSDFSPWTQFCYYFIAQPSKLHIN
jgi:hypothetical protein